MGLKYGLNTGHHINVSFCDISDFNLCPKSENVIGKCERLPDKYYGIQLAAMILEVTPQSGLLLSELRNKRLEFDTRSINDLDFRCAKILQKRLRKQVRKLEDAGLLIVKNYRPEGSIIDHIKIKRKYPKPQR
jgi:hypothetical protein